MMDSVITCYMQILLLPADLFAVWEIEHDENYLVLRMQSHELQ